MALNSLALARIRQISRSTGTKLNERHFDVLEYAWRYYRAHSVGPLYQNILRNTGVGRTELSALFPDGLNSVYTWVGVPVQGKGGGCKAMVALEVQDPREVYLDHNATTPIREEVASSIMDFIQDPRSFGNPSSAYNIGSIAFDVVDRARQRVGECLGVSPGEIYFTGSGTEANNVAVKGLFSSRPGAKAHMVTTSVEHSSVMAVGAWLQSQGHEVTYLPVRRDGTLSIDELIDAIRPDTAVLAVMAANNEIGTIYPLSEIGDICRERNVALVVDAIQGFGKIPLKPRELGISVMTMSGHKIGAPKGVGALFVDDSIELASQTHGGGQEGGLRAGTENVLGIHAMGLAAMLANSERMESTERLLSLREYFLEKLDSLVPDAVVHGTLRQRLPNNLSIGFPGVDSGSLLLSLNQIGIYVSAGSACSASDEKYSHVLQAIGVDRTKYGTVRFSFGNSTTKDDINYLFEHLPMVLDGLKS